MLLYLNLDLNYIYYDMSYELKLKSWWGLDFFRDTLCSSPGTTWSMAHTPPVVSLANRSLEQSAPSSQLFSSPTKRAILLPPILPPSPFVVCSLLSDRLNPNIRYQGVRAPTMTQAIAGFWWSAPIALYTLYCTHISLLFWSSHRVILLQSSLIESSL